MGMFDDVLDKVGEPYTGGSNKGFEYGTHEVIIGDITPKKDSKDREIIEVTVFDEKDNDKTATCTLWFHNDGGAKMSITKVLGLLVHKTGEEKKDAVRTLGKKLFASIDDITQARDVAAKLMTEKLVGEKAFVFVDPSGKYKTSSYGDLWHYEYVDPNADDRAEKNEALDDLTKDGEDVTDDMSDLDI